MKLWVYILCVVCLLIGGSLFFLEKNGLPPNIHPPSKNQSSISKPVSHSQPTPLIEGKAKSVSLTNPDRFLDNSLVCYPQKLYRGDTLTLDMTLPHGGEMFILLPNGKHLWFCYPTFGNGETPPIIESKDFEKMERLQLVTTKAQGIDNETRRYKPIFTQTGWYTIRLSENAEQCDPIYDGEWKVYYSNTPPPSPRKSQAHHNSH